MSLWIRSQDEKILANVTRLVVHGKMIQSLPMTGLEDDYDILGKYETTERAIEVLDEIEEHIRNLAETKAIQDENTKKCNSYLKAVYNMPGK